MKTRKPLQSILVAGMMAGITLSAPAAVVVPNGFENTAGNSQLTTLLQTNARTYQMQVAASHLIALVGQEISGVSFRLYDDASVAFPAADLSWTNYDITLAEAANAIGAFSSTFADNMLNPVQVRSGPLTISAGAFPGGGSPNEWGPVINFNTPYLYLGGDLVIEYRHTGNGQASQFLDALTNNAVAGYIGLGASSYTATTQNGIASTATITQFHVVPEPSMPLLSAVGLALLGCGSRRRRARC